MNRTERRALAHKERKLARKLARAAETQNRTLTVKEGRPTDESVLLNIPGPGGVFPPLSAITPSLQPHVAFDGAAHEVSATDTPTTDTPAERLAELGEKANDEELTPLERAEYEGYIEANNLLAVLQAEARFRLAYREP